MVVIKNMGCELLDLGYDVIFVNMPGYNTTCENGNHSKYINGGGDYIQRNAMTLIEIINNINSKLVQSGSKEEIVLVGPSMGGQVTRYALRYMEKNPNSYTNNGKHNCRLWVSFDSPHYGANIAMGAQAFLEYFGRGLKKVKIKYDNILCCPAAKQMLIKHIADANQTYYNLYYNDLNTLGYPTQARKIAITNGSISAQKTGNDHDVAFRFVSGVGNAKLWFISKNGTTGSDSQVARLFRVGGIQEKKYYTSGVGCGYDGAPGGTYDSFQQIYDDIDKLSGWYTVTINEVLKPKHCFMPTYSTLGYSQGQNNVCQAIPGNVINNIPFDSYWGDNANMEHITINTSMRDWLINEIETYIDPNGPRTINLCNHIAQYSVHFPTGKTSPVTWECSSNLQIISGQSTATIQIKPLSPGKGWVRATLTGNNILTHNKTLKDYAIEVVYDHSATVAPAQITGIQTWNIPYLAVQDITIAVGAQLTVSSTVRMLENCRIIVMPGGKLIVDGGTLTNACESKFWDGISIYGDTSIPISSPSQSRINVTNNGTIANARCGIEAFNGAIVYTDKANFVNNGVNIIFRHLHSGQSGHTGTIYSTNFVRNNSYFGNYNNFTAHILMENSGEVWIANSTFNSLSANSNLCKGIIILNTPTKWSDNINLLSVPVEIQEGALFTNTGILRSNENTKITIHPGGKLLVDGGELSNAYKSEMWQGIFVGGNANLSQKPESNQGVLELKNGAVIKNARNAIATYTLDANGNINYATAGGIVKADNATFLNNLKTADFIPYPPAGTNPVLPNVSYFNKCHFTVDNTNLFALNNDVFSSHIKLWGITGINIKGCKFRNNTTYMANRGRAIFTEDAGYLIYGYCSSSNGLLCQCITPSLDTSVFQGFNKAIESTNTNKQYSIRIDNSYFKNNTIGISMSAKNGFRIAESNMSFKSGFNDAPVGIFLNSCTNYTVEANEIYTAGKSNLKGIAIPNAGTDENRIYRNIIYDAKYGIFVGLTCVQHNADPVRGFPSTGLQFICNDLYDNTYDVFACGDGQIRAVQGASYRGADNLFSSNPNPLYNFYTEDQNSQIMYHYEYSGFRKNPAIRTSNIQTSNATANPCGSTFCDEDEPGDDTDDEDNGKRSTQSSLEEYRRLNLLFSEMMNHFYSMDYDQILTNYYNGIIEYSELVREAMNYHEAILSVTEEMAEIGKKALFKLKTNTIIDLTKIRDWYDEIYTLSAKYSLAETYYQLGAYEEGFNTLALIPEKYNLTESEIIEHNNYVALYTFTNSIKESGRTIAELNEAEIGHLITLSETSQGLSSVMAQGILCFFYDICIEEEAEGRRQKAESDDEMIDLRQSVQSASSVCSKQALENITITPNPTTGELTISPAGGGKGVEQLTINNVEVFDIYGKCHLSHVTRPSSLVTLNISHLSAGLYFIKISTEQGEVVKKVVKQ